MHEFSAAGPGLSGLGACPTERDSTNPTDKSNSRYRSYVGQQLIIESTHLHKVWVGRPRKGNVERHDPGRLESGLLLGGLIVGPRVHDARIVGLCQEHGVSELWTADRDFSRLPGITVLNPLIG